MMNDFTELQTKKTQNQQPDQKTNKVHICMNRTEEDSRNKNTKLTKRRNYSLPSPKAPKKLREQGEKHALEIAAMKRGNRSHETS
jgi:hypothetical protein